MFRLLVDEDVNMTAVQYPVPDIHGSDSAAFNLDMGQSLVKDIEERKKDDIELMRQLPKAELHCHLGGVASPEELIRIAKAAKGDVRRYQGRLQPWLDRMKKLLRQEGPEKMAHTVGPL